MKKTLENTWNEWKPWVQMRGTDKILGAFAAYPAKQKLQVALALSTAKWHPNNDQRGEGRCALCVYSLDKENDTDCNVCPLTTKINGCSTPGSLWRIAVSPFYPPRIQKRAVHKLFWTLMECYTEAMK